MNLKNKFSGPTMASGAGGSGRTVSLVFLSVFLIDYPPIASFIPLSNHRLTHTHTHTHTHPSSAAHSRSPQMASAAHTSALCANHTHRLLILRLSTHTHTHTHTHTQNDLLMFLDFNLVKSAESYQK